MRFQRFGKPAAPSTALAVPGEAGPRTLWAPWVRVGAALGAAFFALLVASGCGPGLGGTGTGAETDALAAYGAREVPVCSSDFGDLLGCTPPGAGAAPAPAVGVRFFAEASPASRTLLEVDGQQAQLRLRCADLVFIGRFGQVGAAAPRFYGQVIEGGSRAQLASMVAERTATGLAVTLLDGDGRTIAGPQALLPVGGTTSAAACP